MNNTPTRAQIPPSTRASNNGRNQTMSQSSQNSTAYTNTMTNSMNLASAVPMLKVMRLQSPELATCQSGSPTNHHLSSSLILPDSFGVIHIGETFTAYLGALNVSTNNVPVTNLSVSSVLQTPTRRWSLPSPLENKFPTSPTSPAWSSFQPLLIEPGDGVDTIISKPLEEVGQHILRVEVSYGGGSTPQQMQEQQNLPDEQNPNPRKTLRKFYRFHVSSPLHIRERTLRGGEASCFVSLAVENASPVDSMGGLTISQTDFQPFPGLMAKMVLPETQSTSTSGTDVEKQKKKSAVELFDDCGRLEPGESRRYLFNVGAASDDAALRGIARGDELGKAVVTWRKAMGEAGRIASTFLFCPASAMVDEEKKDNNGNTRNGQIREQFNPEKDRFVVHGSGLSVDVAAAAADRSASHAPSEIPNHKPLDEIFPVTVEPINPPSIMQVGVPVEVKLLIVNHGAKIQNMQLQMRLPEMKGVVVCGQSFQNLGEISPNGGSHVSTIRLMAMLPGLFFVNGCFVVDLSSGLEIAQPALFSTFVEANMKDDEIESK